MIRAILIAAALLSVTFLTSCENEDHDGINQAQSCIDNTSPSSPASAERCYKYLDDIDSEEADLLRCSIAMFAGGITPVRVGNAFAAMETNGGGASDESYLISTLAMDTTTKANTAAAYCEDSGSTALAYLANLSVIGTQLGSLGGFLGNADDPDFEPTPQEVADGLANCAGDAGCETAIGGALVPIAEDYCAGGNADQAACDSITDAVDAAAGDEERMGELFLCLMQSPPIAPGSCP